MAVRYEELLDHERAPRERYEARLALSEYRFTPGAEIELEWSFTFWNEPLPRGRVTVRLCGTEC